MNSTWYVTSSDTGAQSQQTWGLPGDKPLVGDFDGDGKDDFTVYRPSNGTWYVMYSSTGGTTQKQFGLPGDIPVIGDFDGDGKADFAVYRPSNGYLYTFLSSTGAAGVPRQWGDGIDAPGMSVDQALSPAKEYIYFNGKVVAIENAHP